MQFPNFDRVVPNFIDIRSIIVKSQSGGYGRIHDVVHDLRQIVYCARVYLQVGLFSFCLFGNC